jgi:D-lyxose ketol-isomerase
MKRSEVNAILKEGDAFIRSFGYILPPFAYYSPDELRAVDHEIYVKCAMGWDITDYGQGQFKELGLSFLL